MQGKTWPEIQRKLNKRERTRQTQNVMLERKCNLNTLPGLVVNSISEA